MALAALLFQVSIEGIPTLELWNRHHEVPAGKTDDAFHVTLVVPFGWAAITIFKKIMRLEAAECPCPLSCAIWQYPRHQNLVVIIQDRYRDAAEEAEGPVVAI